MCCSSPPWVSTWSRCGRYSFAPKQFTCVGRDDASAFDADPMTGGSPFESNAGAWEHLPVTLAFPAKEQRNLVVLLVSTGT